MANARRAAKSRCIAFLAIFTVAAAAGGFARAQSNSVIGEHVAGPITVTATALPSFNRFGGAQSQFGKLEYLGGLVLSAPGVEYFGGWSGLALDADGKGFVAVSDRGVWLSGAIKYSGRAPDSIIDARMGPLLSRDGKPFRRKRDRDAEAVAISSGTARAGSLIVAYEQNSRLVRYDMKGGEISTARAVLEKPKSAAGMRRNQGFEAMTVMKGGPHKSAPIALAERFFDPDRNHTGWIWTAKGPETFHLTNVGDFDVTDIASLDDGTLFVLERRFRWLEGLKMRIRRVNAGDLKTGSTVEAEILLEANMQYHIDNMEALGVTRGPAGDIVLTVMSDDNYNFLERSLLLQFSLKDTETAKARPQQ